MSQGTNSVELFELRLSEGGQVLSVDVNWYTSIDVYWSQFILHIILEIPFYDKQGPKRYFKQHFNESCSDRRNKVLSHLV